MSVRRSESPARVCNGEAARELIARGFVISDLRDKTTQQNLCLLFRRIVCFEAQTIEHHTSFQVFHM